jgi:hypothetical protein
VPEVTVQIIPKKDRDAILREEVGWYSSLYGIKSKNQQLVVTSRERKIETNIYIV